VIIACIFYLWVYINEWFSAKYQPYDALHQRFWRQYLKHYDTDDTGNITHLELTSMLDSIGSTLSTETVNSFFTRNNKKPHEDELTMAPYHGPSHSMP
jgi:phosphatidylserine decarboxylase